MTKVVGIRFRNTGKTYFFDPKDLTFEIGDHAIVETAKGLEYGEVVSPVRSIGDENVLQPLKPVIRKATERDDEQVRDNAKKEASALRTCQEKAREHGLDMKVTEAEYAFDNSKILFYFTAEGRVDFRELVKDLASVFHTRIELRQIGVRDEARALGGFGPCGRPLCCSSYLNDFIAVSIKMAKEQNLALNPTKISGVCGRLMCCLKYEEDVYEELNRTMPDVGDYMQTPDGTLGDVVSTNILRQTVRILVDVGGDKEMQEYPTSELTLIKKRKIRKKELSEQAAAERAARQAREAQQGEDAGKQEKQPRKDRGGRKNDRGDENKDRNPKPQAPQEASAPAEDRSEANAGRTDGNGNAGGKNGGNRDHRRHHNHKNRKPQSTPENGGTN
jgi:cell fate regulator YaaT (PSP1 superfamily)